MTAVIRSSVDEVLTGQSGSPEKVVIGPRLTVKRDAVLSLLQQQAADNRAFFHSCAATSVYHQRISESCSEVGTAAELVKELSAKVQGVACRFDFDPETPGNGLRSLTYICDMVIIHLVAALKKCSDTRNSVMFATATFCKELENFSAILRFLVLAFQQVLALMNSLEGDSLFPSLDGDYSNHNGVLKAIEMLDATALYGRSFGFQFAPSVTLIFQGLGVVLATYSLSWGGSLAAMGSFFSSCRYLSNPELRAKQVIKVTREADLNFCRGFWNLSELPPPKFFCPSMEIYRESAVPMCGPLELESKSGAMIEIPEPTAHGPPAPIPMRIFSARRRQGLYAKSKLPLSPKLVVHCHGGGYVATTSKSHETYLRMWAKHLDCPLVSVDYSLSPEFPYPRPTEEIIYAYAWMLKNPEHLGWTGEKIVMVGDSAGGNLIVSLSLKLIELNARRRPDGLVCIYTPFLFQYLPSPSRVLSFMDPLLHMGVVIRCAAAYTGAIKAEKDEQCRKSLADFVADYKSHQKYNADGFNFDNPSIQSMVNLARAELHEQSGGTEDDLELESLPDVEADEIRAEASEPSALSDGGGATVQICYDSSDISISACNYDHTLFTYLKNHPLTMKSTKVYGVDVEESDDVFEDESTLKTPSKQPPSTRKMSRFTTPKCFVQMLASSERRASTKERSRCASLSETVVRSMASGMGQALDNFSHLVEPLQPALGSTDREKLSRTAAVGFEEAAKHEQHAAESVESCFNDLLKLDLPRDFLISPLYAPPEVLQQLPPTRFISLHLDPLLDDTISFAKKMRAAGGRIPSMDLLHGLPHGFLNFAPMSDDCYEGAAICVRRIEESFSYSS